MQDDNPWKPPTDGSGDAEPGGADAAPTAPDEPSPWAPLPDGTAPADAAPSIPPPAVPTPPQPAGPSIPHAVVPSPPQPAVTSPLQAESPPASAFTDGAPTASTAVTTGAPPQRSGRSKMFVGAAVAGIVAIGAAGVFAVTNLTGSTSGGAATPEELGATLMAAIENEDVLGVIDVLSPGERDLFRDPLVDLVDELTRLEILSDDADLARLTGVDVEFSAEQVSAVSTNVADITNIDMRADAVVTFDGAEVPVGDLITDNVPDDMLTEMRGTRVTTTEEFDVRLTAVQEEGRWYFSVFHSIAEAARDEFSPGTLIPLEGIGSDGADTPDDAFNGLLDRVEDLDLTGMLRTLNPGEAAALQRYSPLFLEEAESVLAEIPLDWQVTRRDFRVDESGDTATVLVDALGIDGTIDGEAFSVEFADDCIRAEGMGESFEECGTTSIEDQLGVLDEAPELRRFVDTAAAAFADIEEVGLEMRRTNGQWYVSPVTTVSESMLAVLRALDRSELDALIEQAPAAGEELVDVFLGGLGFGGDDVFFDEPVVEQLEEAIEEPADEPGVAVVEENPNCWSISEADAAAACFELAIASGELDRSSMPVELRHPECGYTAAWGGELYSLPDDEFIAAASAARGCFLDLVDNGLVEAWELPTEIAYLECFEGRNWYQVFDDPEYDDRYYTCIEAAETAGA